MDEKFIQTRISELRIRKDVSERGMSIELGHSPSYIHSIVSGKALPSMTEFLYICEYFKITPKDFFDNSQCNPSALQAVWIDLNALSEKQLFNIHELIKSIIK